MKILMIGDVMGYDALDFLQENLPRIRRERQIDFCVANGENAAPDGLGITVSAARALYQSGVDVITLGNHFRSKKKDLIELFDDALPIVRPHNIQSSVGTGTFLFDAGRTQIGIINLSGRAFINMEVQNPFYAADEAIAILSQHTPVILIDFHAEATSEKYAFFEYVKGRVSAVIGTHTHVQTADEQIQNKTAYLTDLGMTGPHPSVLGMNTQMALRRFLMDTDDKLAVAKGKIMLNGVEIEVDPKTGEALSIRRLYQS